MTATDYETILVDRADGIAVLTLNRPQRLNAWTGQMNADLTAAITDCNEDPNVGAMVVTGAGRGFCAGADIQDNFKARMDSAPEPVAERGKGGQDGGGERRVSDWIGLVRGAKPLMRRRQRRLLWASARR